MNSFSRFIRAFPLIAGCLVCGAPCALSAPRSGEEPNAPATAVDVVLENLKLDGTVDKSLGKDIVNDDKRQTLTIAMYPSQTSAFLVHIKNTGRNMTSFQVHLGGQRLNGGTTKAWAPKGWDCFATLDGETTNVLKELQSEEGWATPLIQSGAEVVLRLAFTTPALAPEPEFFGSFRLSVNKYNASDAVIGHLGVQYVRAVEWSQDFTKWQVVNGTVQLPLLMGVCLRAVRANPNIGWEAFPEYAPTWMLQESWKPKPTPFLGEMISLENKSAGIINFTATGGNKIDGSVVFPTEADEDNDD